MGELASALRQIRNMSTAILQYPNGRFGIVGSIPIELTEETVSGFSVSRSSLVWDTEQGVIDALASIGVTRFQLADCTWYGVKQ